MGVLSNNIQKDGEVGWEEMIQKLLVIFQEDKDSVNIEEVEELLSRYRSNPSDWRKYAKFDKFKYTRNLVHEGNGKFNLMLLCWAEGNQSTIHDHADAHCFVKVLAGSVTETRYHWPEDKKNPDGTMAENGMTECKTNAVTYMSDELGLHRVENPSHSEKAVSLHLYSPPFKACNIFDERTCGKISVPMTFWSKFGHRVNNKKLLKSKTSMDLSPTEEDKPVASVNETKAPTVKEAEPAVAKEEAKTPADSCKKQLLRSNTSSELSPTKSADTKKTADDIMKTAVFAADIIHEEEEEKDGMMILERVTDLKISN